MKCYRVAQIHACGVQNHALADPADGVIAVRLALFNAPDTAAGHPVV